MLNGSTAENGAQYHLVEVRAFSSDLVHSERAARARILSTTMSGEDVGVRRDQDPFFSRSRNTSPGEQA
jgi:hypothetical protein